MNYISTFFLLCLAVLSQVAIAHPCIPNPCQHNGFCSAASEYRYKCTCMTAWEGDTCAICRGRKIQWTDPSQKVLVPKVDGRIEPIHEWFVVPSDQTNPTWFDELNGKIVESSEHVYLKFDCNTGVLYGLIYEFNSHYTFKAGAIEFLSVVVEAMGNEYSSFTKHWARTAPSGSSV